MHPCSRSCSRAWCRPNEQRARAAVDDAGAVVVRGGRAAPGRHNVAVAAAVAGEVTTSHQ